jgi:hypothetical protein
VALATLLATQFDKHWSDLRVLRTQGHAPGRGMAAERSLGGDAQRLLGVYAAGFDPLAGVLAGLLGELPLPDDAAPLLQIASCRDTIVALTLRFFQELCQPVRGAARPGQVPAAVREALRTTAAAYVAHFVSLQPSNLTAAKRVRSPRSSSGSEQQQRAAARQE